MKDQKKGSFPHTSTAVADPWPNQLTAQNVTFYQASSRVIAEKYFPPAKKKELPKRWKVTNTCNFWKILLKDSRPLVFVCVCATPKCHTGSRGEIHLTRGETTRYLPPAASNAQEPYSVTWENHSEDVWIACKPPPKNHRIPARSGFAISPWQADIFFRPGRSWSTLKAWRKGLCSIVLPPATIHRRTEPGEESPRDSLSSGPAALGRGPCPCPWDVVDFFFFLSCSLRPDPCHQELEISAGFLRRQHHRARTPTCPWRSCAEWVSFEERGSVG